MLFRRSGPLLTALQAGGVEPNVGSAEKLLAKQRSEAVFWQGLVKAKHITLDKLQ